MSRWVPHVPAAVSLRRLFPSASFVGCGDIVALHATDRSGDCRPQSLFAVIRGPRHDGHNYIAEAISHGAKALLVDRPQPNVNVLQCIVPDVRRAYAEVCAAIMSHPCRQLALAGVTGTNGKTTTTWLIRSILQAAGQQTGLLGTIEYHDGKKGEAAALTTPDSRSFSDWLRRMVVQGTTHAAMELSSHSLDQRRTAGTLLDAAVITNITQDHFDYHGTYENYRRSKLRIFDYLKPAGMAIVNADDPGSRSCMEDAPKRVLSFGMDEPADVQAMIQDVTLEGSRFRLRIGVESCDVQTHLIGRHNISNCLAAAAVAAHLDVSLAEIAEGIESLTRVPGRMDAVGHGSCGTVFIDFAHTPDALNRAVQTLKSLTTGRVFCVFGAGGDRDKTKRPLMGKAASAADVVVVTSDNPRSEDPAEIAREIVAGCNEWQSQLPRVELDRRAAIQWALSNARPGDAVLIAGKGHETEQICGTTRTHFDDREVVEDFLKSRSIISAPHGFRRVHA